ncbi:WD40 repeat-like protein [Ramicandelaber brevisporus]|nr:WD40 repeat-like protein [Ramicandelaber brevisporus]
MAAPYSKVEPLRLSRAPVEDNASEARYWSRFQQSKIIKEFGAPTDIHFSSASPHDFSIAASARVQVYCSQTHVAKRAFTRFKDTAYCANIRSDGKLLVTGDATGLIQLFDLGSKSLLRSLRTGGHTRAVRKVRFGLHSKTMVMSTSDDTTVRIWDIPSETTTAVFTDHTDYIRAGVVSPISPSLFVTGSYDRTVRLWDSRINANNSSSSGDDGSSSGACVMTFTHPEPIDDVVMFPSGSLVAVAGGPMVRIYDVLSGGRLVYSMDNHEKSVTSLSLNSSGSRLLAGSLDHHLKVYDVTDYKVVYSNKYPAPILTIGLSPDDSNLVVGTSTSIVSIRHRKPVGTDASAPVMTSSGGIGSVPANLAELDAFFGGSNKLGANKTKKSSKPKKPQGGTRAHFTRGSDAKASAEDVVIESQRRARLADYDKMLKNFQYGNALNAVLARDRTALNVISVIQELIQRGGLKIALGGRDDIALEPIVRFVTKNIGKQQYTSILLDVAHVILDMYGGVVGESPLIDDLLQRLRIKVSKELTLQKSMLQMQGALEMVFANALSSTKSLN